MSARKAHVLEAFNRVGGFHIEFTATCRCGWTYTHYNAGAVRAEFKAHKDERERAGELLEVQP